MEEKRVKPIANEPSNVKKFKEIDQEKKKNVGDRKTKPSSIGKKGVAGRLAPPG